MGTFSRKYCDKKVNFVEIDTANAGDVVAIRNIAKYWRNSLYVDCICDTAMQKYNGNDYFKPYKLYAMTLQKDELEKLDDKKILGIVEIIKPHESKSSINLHHIEVNPEYIYSQNSKYKGIGTAMIKSLQDMYYQINLISRRTKSVKNFYKKNNFTEYPPESGIFIWSKDIFLNFIN